MKRENQFVAGQARWMWVAVAILTIVGASGTALAKERTKNKTTTESKPAEKSANGGYIGVHLQDLTDEVRQGLDLKVSKGVLVSGVEEDSPADEAGIEEGDVIVAFNGTSVSSPDQLRDAVRSVEPGDEGRVDVMRDGKSRTITVTVGDRPEPQLFRWESGDDDMAPMHVERLLGAMGGPRLGVQAHEIEDDGLASYFGAKKGDGLLVLSVDDESIAGKAGVQPGDIIRQVGDEKITEVGDVRSALHDYKEGDQFDITVLRHGKSQSLKATMDDQEHEFAFEMPAPGAFRWHGATPAPRGGERHYRDGRDDLRRELDDLRQELRELKEKFEERNDG